MFFRIFADDYEIVPTWFISPSCLLIPLASQDHWNSGELVFGVDFLSSFFTKLHFFSSEEIGDLFLHDYFH